MKRSTKTKKLQLIKENQKISSFFTGTSKNDSTNAVATSSLQHSKSTVLSSKSTSPSTSNHKKRKQFEETDSTLPEQLKKAKEIQIVNTQVIKIEDDIEVSCLKLSISVPPSPKKVLSIVHVTPEKNIANMTPTKESPILNGSVGKKYPSKTNGTPSKSPKSTPTKKLFNKSPKRLEEFNIQVIDNFVKITPSKSNKKIVVSTSKSVSPGKMQSSLLAYISPSGSKSVLAKAQNENTPTKQSPSIISSPRSVKVKTKLNFDISELSAEKEKPPCTTGKVNGFSSPEKELAITFDDDSWDDQLNAITDALYNLNLSKSQHCKVLEVQKFSHTLKLLLESTETKEKAVCHLQGFWAHLNVRVGDILHVSAKEGSSGWQVSNDQGLVVFEPDFLISSTSVVASLFCKRRAVLSEHYRAFDPSNRFMVIGSLVHKFLQDCLQCQATSETEIEQCMKTILKSRDTVQMLYTSSLSLEDVEAELKTFVPRILSFIKQYINKKGTEKKAKDNWQGTIDSVEDIEENFWCPELGVKGKVDVSVRSGDLVMPVELKTGKASVSLEHRGQVILYMMMMEKFGYNVNSGLLLYLREGVLKEIDLTEREKRDITILRNELAYHLTRHKRGLIRSGNQNDAVSIEDLFKKSVSSSFLPEPINHHRACGSCPYNTICCTYLKTENFDLSQHKNLQEVQVEKLAHLKESHIEYFIHWSCLLTLETTERRDNKELQEIFTIPPSTRQKNGKCIAELSLVSVEFCNGLYYSTFKRLGDKVLNFMTSAISENQYVVISKDGRPAVAAGFVTKIDDNSIVVTLERDLKKKFPSSNFHIDTYDSNNTNLFNMTNLACLLEGTERSRRLCELIIDKVTPHFREKLPRNVVKIGAPILRRLNKVQQRAVLRALAADDYLLIKGMPGTGKTSTIVALIQLLVELGKSVLVTSHTHSAVDNVCVRLLKYNINVLRLGSSKRVHPDLVSFCEDEITKNCNTPTELESVYEKAKVVAVTCLGSGHPLLSKRIFDMCIVDESTQVLQPSVLRALFATQKFVLIGDPDQLPPLVRNQEAIKKGMSESLFERLQGFESNVTLNLNYRMNKPITNLANGLTYNGELLTANEEVANSHLHLPKFNELLAIHRNTSWILEALDECLTSSVKVLDTGPVWNLKLDVPLINQLKTTAASVQKDGVMNCCNPYETVVIAILVYALLKAGISSDSIGIIAPYRAQVAQITSLLQSTNIEISTIDQFQGRDKNVVLFSATKSSNSYRQQNDERHEVLRDTRRINVAITRAKQKLIFVCDRETLKEYKPFLKVFNCLEESCFVKLVQKPEDFCDIVGLLDKM